MESDLLDFGDSSDGMPPKVTMPHGPAFTNRSAPVPTQPGIELTDGPPSMAEFDLNGPDSSFGSDEDVDIYTENNRPPSLTDSGTLEISEEVRNESERRAAQLESSSIDMNSRPGLSSSEFEIGKPAEASAKSKSESDVDLALPSTDDEGSSSVIVRRAALDSDQQLLAEKYQARPQPSPNSPNQKRARSPRVVMPSSHDELPPARRRGYLLHGGVIGLLLGAGGILAAYFGGALPDRKSHAATPPAIDSSALLEQSRQEARAAKADANQSKASVVALKKSLTDAGIDPADPANSIKQLSDAKIASDTRVKSLTDELETRKNELAAAQTQATNATAAERAAKKSQVSAEAIAANTKKQLDGVNKALEEAKTDVLAAKKSAANALQLAQTRELEAKTKLADAAKREMALVAAVDAAKSTAEDAAKARDAHAATIAAIGDRLTKAKFVGDKPNAAAIVKGLDSAIKAASTDATSALRNDLAKAHAAEAKLSSELEAKSAKLDRLNKTESEARAERDKFATEASKYKATADRLSKELTDASSSAAAAEKLAAQEKANAAQLATETARLKVDNRRLARDLQAVRELADLIKSQPASERFVAKPDPARIADRFFNDGLRAYYAGEYPGAQSSFRKALQFHPDDARYHYLLGLSLWMANDLKAAQKAFEDGRDLEMDARPPSRVISRVLERIQGPARQAVNAYRP